MQKDKLDFVIIGAQKAGTTSLFVHLNEHPQIFMPLEKEAPFFNHEERLARGVEWYFSEFFSMADPEQTWGKATPNYMVDVHVPARIYALMPDIKLIALLRDPVERAYSNYLMSRRRNLETEEFEPKIRKLLSAERLCAARTTPDRTNSYVVRGEYGRLLSLFYEYFPAEQIAVFFTDELRQNPRGVVRAIFQFLGVDEAFLPSTLGEVYHTGGARLRFQWVYDLFKWQPIRSLWHRMPGRYRRPLAFWFEQWNVVSAEERRISPQVRELLVAHYERDIRHLETMLGRPVPWAAWHEPQRQSS